MATTWNHHGGVRSFAVYARGNRRTFSPVVDVGKKKKSKCFYKFAPSLIVFPFLYRIKLVTSCKFIQISKLVRRL